MEEPNAERDSRLLAGRHILIVEDDNDSREMLCVLLQLQGAHVHPTSSASQAMAMLAGFVPDVVISDIHMPGGDGIRLVAEIRALPDEKLSRVPALALSGFRDQSDRTKALEAGFDMLAMKPIDTPKLVELVAWLLKSVS